MTEICSKLRVNKLFTGSFQVTWDGSTLKPVSLRPLQHELASAHSLPLKCYLETGWAASQFLSAISCRVPQTSSLEVSRSQPVCTFSLKHAVVHLEPRNQMTWNQQHLFTELCCHETESHVNQAIGEIFLRLCLHSQRKWADPSAPHRRHCGGGSCGTSGEFFQEHRRVFWIEPVLWQQQWEVFTALLVWVSGTNLIWLFLNSASDLQFKVNFLPSWTGIQPVFAVFSKQFPPWGLATACQCQVTSLEFTHQNTLLSPACIAENKILIHASFFHMLLPLVIECPRTQQHSPTWNVGFFSGTAFSWCTNKGHLRWLLVLSKSNTVDPRLACNDTFYSLSFVKQ